MAYIALNNDTELAPLVASEVARQLSSLIDQQQIVRREWVSPREAATIVGMSIGGLEMRRQRGNGPPYSKHGPRIVRYRVRDLHTWMEAAYHVS